MNREQGLKIMDEMLGEEASQQVRQGWEKICPDFEEYVVGFLAGEVWSRPGLDRKIKSLCTVAVLAAMGRQRGVELNIRMAHKNGVTRQEMMEMLLQIAPYAGFPAAWEAIAQADEIYTKLD